MALVHRNAALGEAPVGQLPFAREAHVSLRSGAQPRQDGLRSPLRLVFKDSLAKYPEATIKNGQEEQNGQRQGLR